MWNDVLKFKAK